MKKLAAAVIFIFLMNGIQVYALEKTSISFADAKISLFKNNSSLVKLKYAEIMAERRYNDVIESLKDVRIPVYTNIQEHNAMLYNTMMIKKYKYLSPQQMEYSLQASKNDILMAKRSLEAGLRDMYLSLFSAYCDIDIKQKRLGLAQKIFDKEKLKFKKGVISKLDLEMAEFSLMQAGNQLKASMKNRENICRSFNLYIGAPISATYDSILYREYFSGKTPENIGNYIQKALENRLELVNLRKEISMKEYEIELLEEEDTYKMTRAATNEYNTMLRQLEDMNISLDMISLDIENEIRVAFTAIKKENGNIMNMKKTLEIQKKSIEKAKVQCKAGMIPDTAIDEMQIGIDETENNIKIAIVGYNSKLTKFYNAVGSGPSY